MQNGASDGPERLPVPQVAGDELIRADGYHYPDYPSTYYGGGAEPPEGTDWVRLGKVLWQRKWWIAFALVLGTTAGYLASQYVSPQYRASTTIWIEESNDRSGPIQSENPFAGEGFADVFRSRAVLQPVVETRKLYLSVQQPEEPSPDLMADFSVSGDFVPGFYTLAVLDDGRWSLRRGEKEVIQRGRLGDPIGEPSGFLWNPPASAIRPGATIRFQAATPQQAALRLRGALNIRFNRSSRIIHATFTWVDPVEAADILNALADQFLTTSTDLKAQKIREQVQMLREQTEFSSQRLEAAELALENHRISTITLPSEPTISPIVGAQGTRPSRGQGARDPVFDAYFQKKIYADQLESDLRQLTAVRTSIENGGSPNTLALQLIPSAQASVELQTATDRLLDLQLERRALLSTFTEEAPQVTLLSERVRALEREVIPSVIDDIATEVRNQLAVVRDQIDAQTTELRQIPSRTIEGARREREVVMAEALHNLLLNRLKEAELAEATSGSGIQVLDPAWPANSPVSNSRPRIVVLFSMASLGIGVAGVLLHDRLDKKIRYPDQVTTGLGLPVLGVVPRLGRGNGRAGAASAAVAIESFRGLRTQIAHADGQVGGILMVTSPAPQEGKSMVSANLAISYATAGHRTILVDGDTRRGRAQEMFGLQRSPGLTDYLMGHAAVEEVEQSTEVENLSLIARGRSRGFNADLLDGEEVEELVAKLRESYEVVVVDAPPLAAGADVLMLGKRVDKVVIVLRAGATHEDLAKTKLAGLGNVQLPIIGAVLNAMPKSAPYYDRYVHYYYADAEPVT